MLSKREIEVMPKLIALTRNDVYRITKGRVHMKLNGKILCGIGKRDIGIVNHTNRNKGVTCGNCRNAMSARLISN